MPSPPDDSHVPLQYKAQIQTLLEVLDLERCVYLEYHPGDTWTPRQVEWCTIQRDRVWWAEAEPKLKAFYDEMQRLRTLPKEELDALVIARAPRRRLTGPPPAPRHVPFPFRFVDRPASGLPSGQPDEFYEAPEVEAHEAEVHEAPLDETHASDMEVGKEDVDTM